jgi:hypothetical protein
MLISTEYKGELSARTILFLSYIIPLLGGI